MLSFCFQFIFGGKIQQHKFRSKYFTSKCFTYSRPLFFKPLGSPWEWPDGVTKNRLS